MFGTCQDWILSQIIYPTKTCYPTNRWINESLIEDGIVLSRPDMIK